MTPLEDLACIIKIIAIKQAVQILSTQTLNKLNWRSVFAASLADLINSSFVVLLDWLGDIQGPLGPGSNSEKTMSLRT